MIEYKLRWTWILNDSWSMRWGGWNFLFNKAQAWSLFNATKADGQKIAEIPREFVGSSSLQWCSNGYLKVAMDYSIQELSTGMK